MTDRGSREVGQHSYELADTSRLDNEASVSNATEEAFCSQGIHNDLIVVDLERIRGKYQLPPSFSLAILFGDAHNRQPVFVTLY